MKQTARLNLETVEGKGLRFAAETGARTFQLDSGDDVDAPSPMEAVLAAIGGCTGMDVISVLRKMRQNVTAYELLLNAERSEEHPRVFTAVEVVHRFTGENLNPAMIERAIELSETRYCSVHAMLAPSVRLSSRYELVPAASQTV